MQSEYIQISLHISAFQSGSALVAVLIQAILQILFANSVDLIRLCEYAGLIWSTLVTCIILDGIVSVAMRKDFRAFANSLHSRPVWSAPLEMIESGKQSPWSDCLHAHTD